MIVLLDLDGTVWDSEEGIVRCIAHALGDLGMDVPPRPHLVAAIGPPLRLMLAGLGVPEDHLDRGVAAYRERYLTVGVFESELYPGVEDMLDRLAGDGHTLATATSKGEVPTHTMLEHFGLLPRFAVVGAATMDGTATTKSEVITRTLAALGGPAAVDCWMVGDRHYDVRGAAEHGIPCVGATWGYGGAEELRQAGAAALAHTPADVPGLLGRR
ncbi:MAG: HAD hydrolase-like protein [Microthrixaceae bacterium]